MWWIYLEIVRCNIAKVFLCESVNFLLRVKYLNHFNNNKTMMMMFVVLVQNIANIIKNIEIFIMVVEVI